MKRESAAMPGWLPPLLPLVAVFLLTAPYWLAGRIPISAEVLMDAALYRPLLAPALAGTPQWGQEDPIYQSYVQEWSNHLEVRTGRLELWDPSIHCGYPAIGFGHSSRLYPVFELLHRLVPDAADFWALAMILHLLGGAGGMYALARRLGLGPWPAAFAGTAWALNGCVGCWLEFGLYGFVTWLPWMLYSLDRAVALSSLPWGLAAGVEGGCLLLFPSTQFALYVFLTCGLVISAMALAGRYGQRRLPAAVGWVVLSAAIAGGLAAPLVLPFLEMGRLSQRASAVAWDDLWRSNAVRPEHLLTQIAPDLFGHPRTRYFWVRPGDQGNYINRQAYAGALTLVLAAACVGPGLSSSGVCFAAVGLFGLAMAMMLLPVYWPFYRFVIGFDRLDASRILLVYEFCLVMVAAHGLQRVLADEALRRRCWRAAALVALGLLAASLAMHVVLALPVSWGTIGLLRTKSPEKVAWFLQCLARDHAFPGSALLLPAGVWALAAAALRCSSAFRHAGAGVLLLWTVLVADLVGFGLRLQSWEPRQLILPEPRAVSWLKRQPGPFRVTALGQCAPSNTLRPFGLSDARGYTSLIVRWHFEMVNALGRRSRPSLNPQKVELDELDARLARALNVAYVLSERELPAADYEWVRRDEVTIYAVRGVLPRARFVTDWQVVAPAETLARTLDRRVDLATTAVLAREPAWQAPGVRPQPAASPPEVLVDLQYPTNGSAVARFECERPGLLLLADTYYPGWRVWLDGREGEVLRANHSLRAVAVSTPGPHTVELRFDPPLSRLGNRLCLATILLVGVLLGVAGVRLARPALRTGVGRRPSHSGT